MDRREKFSTFSWVIIAIAYVLGFQYLGVGGYERPRFQAAMLNNGIFPKIANPPYIFALLYPLALLPIRWGILTFSFISIGILYLTHRLTHINKWLLLLSFPVIRILFYSQLDMLSMLGVSLGWWAVQNKKPVWLGVALTLLGVKPHVTVGLGIIYAVWGWHIKILIVPILVLTYSFLLYGFWLPDWIEHTVNQSVGTTPFFQGGLGAFPWGLLAWLPLLFRYRGYSKIQMANSIMAATMLSAPYVGFYSVLVFLGLPISWVTYLFVLPLNVLIDMRIVLVLIVLSPLFIDLWNDIHPSPIILKKLEI